MERFLVYLTVTAVVTNHSLLAVTVHLALLRGDWCEACVWGALWAFHCGVLVWLFCALNKI